MIRTVFILFLLGAIFSPSAQAQDIYSAIDSGQIDRVENFLKRNPELLNTKNENAMTPLNWAAYKGQKEIVQLLLEAGADVTLGDNENSQPIHNAAVAGHTEVIETLLASGVDINSRDNNGMTALHFALSYRQLETAALLLDKGADLNASNHNGFTSLHYAALGNFTDLINRLVSSDGNINVQSQDGTTPLLFASGRGNFEATTRLLELGANTELANDYGRTPLLNVVRESGNVEMARLLIEHGADINALDIFGDSPIVLAAWRGYKAIVNLLLDHNAEVPVDGHRGLQLIRYSAKKGLERLMKKLVTGGADLSITGQQGASLLHAAAFGGSAEIVNILLERKLPADQADVFGWTPLHYAAGKGRLAVCEILIEHGVDINLRTISGLSPLNLAESHDRVETKELLIANKADTSPRQFPKSSEPYFGMVPPGTTPELFAPDIVSTSWGGHSSVAFSPDGTEALWTSYYMPSDSGYGRGRILSSKISDNHWSVPRSVPFADDDNYDDVPFFSQDGSRLYFISRRPYQPGGRGREENIWIVEKTGTGWGEPYPAPGEVNSIDMHWQFSVAASGSIYFAGEGLDQLGRGDIYKSILVNGAYTAPVNLGNVINTEAGETSPYIAPDESFLIFASSGHQSVDNQTEIYISWNRGDGEWTTPVSTGLRGLCPILSPDGKYLFYNGVLGDVHGVFWVKADFLEELKHKSM